MRNTNLTARVHALQRRQASGDSEGDHDDDAVAVDGFRPLLPDGWYEAKYIGHETGMVFMAPKCFLHFEITQFGDHFETRLFRAFRVRKLAGRPGKGGKFVCHAGGDLYALLCRLLDVKLRTDTNTF